MSGVEASAPAAESDGIDESIEPAYRRGEWATQAELTWRHTTGATGSRSERRITFSVVHVPNNAIAISYLSRTEARELVEWLVRDVPHLDVPALPGTVMNRLGAIVAAVQYLRCVGWEGRELSVADLEKSDWRAQVRELWPGSFGGCP